VPDISASEGGREPGLGPDKSREPGLGPDKSREPGLGPDKGQPFRAPVFDEHAFLFAFGRLRVQLRAVLRERKDSYSGSRS
jgi:hypothetical protein